MREMSLSRAASVMRCTSCVIGAKSAAGIGLKIEDQHRVRVLRDEPVPRQPIFQVGGRVVIEQLPFEIVGDLELLEVGDLGADRFVGVRFVQSSNRSPCRAR